MKKDPGLQEGPLLVDASEKEKSAALPIKPDLTDLSDLIQDSTTSPFSSEVACFSNSLTSYHALLQITYTNCHDIGPPGIDFMSFYPMEVNEVS